MKNLAKQCRDGLLVVCITAFPSFSQAATAQADEESGQCETLQTCIEKYRQKLPEWEGSIKEFGTRLEDELPKIEKDFKAFGKEGEKQLRYWLDQLEKKLPRQNGEQTTPETTWI
jgi:hypothetical protein